MSPSVSPCLFAASYTIYLYFLVFTNYHAKKEKKTHKPLNINKGGIWSIICVNLKVIRARA